MVYMGALTNKPYAFENRPWELHNVNSIDIFDALGSSISVYTYGSDIKRILPLKNDTINEDWISNRTRYFFEGLHKWRINIPLIKKRNSLIYVSWIQSFKFYLLKIWFFSARLNNKIFSFILNSSIDYDLIISAKILCNFMGYSLHKSNKMYSVNDFYLFYINPYFFHDIKSKKNIYVFLGMNLRLESPILNIKFRKNLFNDELIYCNIGSNFNDNLNTLSLGLNIKNLLVLLKGKSKFNINLMKLIKKSSFDSNFMFLVGNNLFYQKDNLSIYKYLSKCVQNLKKFKNLKYYKSKKYIVGALNKKLNKKFDLNVNIQFMNLFSILYEDIVLKRVHDIVNISKVDLLYILNGNYFFKKKMNQFVVFQGHHIDIKLLDVDVVFPNTNFLEKASKFLNIEGKYLKTNKVVSKPYLTRNDWTILNALYLYSLNFINKVYNFKLKLSKLNFLNSNRFYIDINLIDTLSIYGVKYTVSFFYNEISRYYYYKNNFIKTLFCEKIFKIYNKVIINFYFNNYNLNVLEKYSSTLKLVSNNLVNNFWNHTNINI